MIQTDMSQALRHHGQALRHHGQLLHLRLRQKASKVVMMIGVIGKVQLPLDERG